MTMAKVVGDGRVTLTAETRDVPRPASTADRARAWDELMAIIDEPKWQGPGPVPSDDELLEMANDAVHRMREEDDQGRP